MRGVIYSLLFMTMIVSGKVISDTESHHLPEKRIGLFKLELSLTAYTRILADMNESEKVVAMLKRQLSGRKSLWVISNIQMRARYPLPHSVSVRDDDGYRHLVDFARRFVHKPFSAFEHESYTDYLAPSDVLGRSSMSMYRYLRGHR